MSHLTRILVDINLATGGFCQEVGCRLLEAADNIGRCMAFPGSAAGIAYCFIAMFSLVNCPSPDGSVYPFAACFSGKR